MGTVIQICEDRAVVHDREFAHRFRVVAPLPGLAPDRSGVLIANDAGAFEVHFDPATGEVTHWQDALVHEEVLLGA